MAAFRNLKKDGIPEVSGPAARTLFSVQQLTKRCRPFHLVVIILYQQPANNSYTKTYKYKSR